MTNANELRIGNYVNTPNGVKRVSTISVDGWSMHTESEPIPLTEEWLFRFGFIYNGWNYDFERYRFHAQGRNGDEFYNTEFYINNKGEHVLISFNIKYVHQLQNIYFALTGRELTYKK